ncbi:MULTISPECIES: N-acetylmuramoyl-L-alanine amidase family protein [Virgibacillus]|uniref:N-acetylmuramoyl-L-alanine amidase LytC n=1 Tax=Virgibacillus massiliensis TaxID=1462526 RepID=A0A024QED9_9BACI|nr:N-acetylmuramoyl-L-alanine amidase [Virgibacillus massiliensis]CDQ40602.1 N-acetylmuramoyl-L-alanine amidase LytC precursor [Virgibacillus massiliensis]
MKKNMLFITLFLFSTLILSACTSNPDNNNVKHNNSKNSNTAFKVVIDAGHGGKDVGASGESGQYEKDFTLSVSKKVEKLLGQDPAIEVFMTRTDDSFLSQESRYRPKYANDIDADLFISIHGNTFSDPNVSGTETFYYHNNSRLFAETLQKHVVEATGFRDRGIKKQDLFVVKDTKMPAALIEVGYLTNLDDESKMWKDDFQNRVATSIVEGIKEYQEKSEKQGNWIF